MNWGRWIAFLLGAAVLVALTVYAGFGDVIKTLARLHVSGLILYALAHLPVIALLGLAWWLVGGGTPGGAWLKFAWARLVRDGAAEVLPFSQLGGYVLGVRALHLKGVGAWRGAASMSIDLVMELWAKLPYFLAGVLAFLALAPHSRLFGALLAALGLTVLAVALPVLFRHRLRRALEASALAIAQRWPSFGSSDELKSYFDLIFAEPQRLVAAFAAHLGCWVLGAAETWIAFHLMGVAVTPLQALMIDSLVSGLRSFAFLVPAAAGVQEASYVLVCAIVGLSPATAVAVSLARRARDLVLGVPALAAWQYLEANFRLKTATSDK